MSLRSLAIPLGLTILGACSGPIMPMTPGESNIPPSSAGGDALMCSDQLTAPARLALLTRRQYDNVVRDLLGDVTEPATVSFPPEARGSRFFDTASHQINSLLADLQSTAAEAVATRATTERMTELAPCAAGQAPSTCGAAFVDAFGPRAFRRPLTPNERALFVGLFDTTLAAYDYQTAIRAVITGTLQSPQFLYRVDAHAGTRIESGDAVQLDAYETASRLSFFLYDSMPDEELFAAAARGELTTQDQVEAEARRMLQDPKARSAVRNFFSLWLGLSELDTATREVTAGVDPTAYDMAWKESLLRFVDYVYWEKAGSLEELFTSDVVFLNADLGALYGMAVTGTELVAVHDPNRYGLLTQPGLMALLAHSEQSSPILRGVFLRSHVLCQPPPAPPPSVDTTPPDPDPNATTRERFAQHTESSECAGCHSLIDPLGFTFEAFDHAGRFRDAEDGIAVDTNGSIVGLTDQTLNGDYANVRELSDRLLASPQLRNCIAKQWFRHALVRPDSNADECSLGEVQATLKDGKNDLVALLVEMTLTDAFRFRSAGDQDL